MKLSPTLLSKSVPQSAASANSSSKALFFTRRIRTATFPPRSGRPRFAQNLTTAHTPTTTSLTFSYSASPLPSTSTRMSSSPSASTTLPATSSPTAPVRNAASPTTSSSVLGAITTALSLRLRDVEPFSPTPFQRQFLRRPRQPPNQLFIQ